MTQRSDAGSNDDKEDALQQSGALNPHPQDITDDLFRTNAFFDRRDLVQVRYEMLRRARVDGLSIAQAADLFGVSRPAFYHALEAFDTSGLPGLIRKRPGPKRAHKLSAEVVAYLEQLRSEDATISAVTLAKKLRRKFALVVHPRSIERALQRRQKKGR